MNIRNIAIIAHVDHGKTTLVDQLLRKSGTFRENEEIKDRVMDSNDIEKERGITILSKTTSIHYNGVKINILDTPGHADFGGEVERIMNMVDGVLLVVDAYEGTMPQTRFVLKKAKTAYVSALNGTASLDPDLSTQKESYDDIFKLIIDEIPEPKVSLEGSLQFQPALLDYNDFVGRIGIGKIFRGTIKVNQMVSCVRLDGSIKQFRVQKLFGFEGLKRVEIESAEAGDIVAIAGMPDISVGETVCEIGKEEALPILRIDEPTLKMTFMTNDSPFVGLDGDLITASKLGDRLFKETQRDVSLKVEQSGNESWIVSGRGELHLSILIENMRREGYELQVSRPEVITKEINGVKCEPYESVQIEVPEEYVGNIIESLGSRGATMQNMSNLNNLVRLNYLIPARGLIGFMTEFMTKTSGYGIINHSFAEYAPCTEGTTGERKLGVLVSMENGKSTAYSIGNLEDRGTMFIEPGTDVYEGMIVGECNRDNDLAVNVVKGKQLTNTRAAGSDHTVVLKKPRPISLEYALEYINMDELVEVTPKNIRLRKTILNTELRKKADSKKEN